MDIGLMDAINLQKKKEVGLITSVLSKNAGKNFVRRIVNPDLYPILDYGNGNYATHKMSWEEVDGKPIVFPLVVENKKGILEELPIKDALDYALKNNEFIPFNSRSEADWFTKNYKRVWE